MALNLNILSAYIVDQIAQPKERNEPIHGKLMRGPRNKWNLEKDDKLLDVFLKNFILIRTWLLRLSMCYFIILFSHRYKRLAFKRPKKISKTSLI